MASEPVAGEKCEPAWLYDAVFTRERGRVRDAL